MKFSVLVLTLRASSFSGAVGNTSLERMRPERLALKSRDNDIDANSLKEIGASTK